MMMSTTIGGDKKMCTYIIPSIWLA